jgi:hypothetical protein
MKSSSSSVKMVVLNIFLASSLAFSVCALPHVAVKRQISQLRDSYDFIIAGGGTSGLTVADRLSAAFPHSKLHPITPSSPFTTSPTSTPSL